MKRLIAGLFAITILTLTLAKPLYAQTEYPLLSIQRLSVAGGVSYDWYNNAAVDRPVKPSLLLLEREWSVGLYSAYLLTRNAALVSSGTYGLDTQQIRYTAGLRVVLWRGSE